MNILNKWLKVRKLWTFIIRGSKRVLGLTKPIFVEHRLDEYRKYWQDAAQALSAKFVSYRNDLWEVRLNGRHTRISNHVVQLNDPIIFLVSSNKGLCYKWAIRLGVPVPAHKIFRLEELRKAKKFFLEQSGFYVVKPVDGTSSGVGITTHVRTVRQLKRAAILASLFSSQFIVEKMIFGESCRLLFLDGKLIHAVRRRGVRVTGDGFLTLHQLMDRLGFHDIKSDITTATTLSEQGLSLDSVLENGREYLVRSLPANEHSYQELRTEYNESITHLISPALIEEVSRMVMAVESRFAGVDVITNDPGRKLKETGGVFLEINPSPGIHHHYIDGEKNAPVAVTILKHLLQIPG